MVNRWVWFVGGWVKVRELVRGGEVGVMMGEGVVVVVF